MDKVKGPCGVFWVCGACDGRSATVSLLRRSIPNEVVNTLWQSARNHTLPHPRPCPACTHRMTEVPMTVEGHFMHLDVCTRCHFTWLDPHEFDALPKLPPPPTKPTLSPEAREKLALLEVASLREKADAQHAASGDAPSEDWKWLPGLLGMPVEMNAQPLTRIPWATWIAALLIALASGLAFFDLERVVNALGLIPAEAGRLGGATWITSFFIHGGIMHLVGNLYFFLVFGDNVEEFLGRGRFLLLLFAATLVGSLAHLLGDPRSAIPCIGASGGISGVIAYYALRFPQARIGYLTRPHYRYRRFYGHVFNRPRWVYLPAWGFFLFWLLLQFLGVWQQISGFSNVSALAHLGGAAVGLGFWVATSDLVKSRP